MVSRVEILDLLCMWVVQPFTADGATREVSFRLGWRMRVRLRRGQGLARRVPRRVLCASQKGTDGTTTNEISCLSCATQPTTEGPLCRIPDPIYRFTSYAFRASIRSRKCVHNTKFFRSASAGAVIGRSDSWNRTLCQHAWCICVYALGAQGRRVARL